MFGRFWRRFRAPSPVVPAADPLGEFIASTATSPGPRPRAPARFALLAGALAACHDRERRAVEQLEALEAEPRPNGRAQGLDYALLDARQSLEFLRQARDLLIDLARVEPEVRALLEARIAALSGPSSAAPFGRPQVTT